MMTVNEHREVYEWAWGYLLINRTICGKPNGGDEQTERQRRGCNIAIKKRHVKR